MAITMQNVTAEQIREAVDKIKAETHALAISLAGNSPGGGVKVLEYRPASDDYAVLFNEGTVHFFTVEDAVRHFNAL